MVAAQASWTGPSYARLRTRELPDFPGRLDPELRSRAQEIQSPRIHAIVEAPSGARSEAERAGCTLLLSIDGDLWLASLPAAQVGEGDLARGLRRAWNLQSEDRAAPEFLAAVRNISARSISSPLPVRIKWFADSDPAEIRRVLAHSGAEIVREAWPLFFADVRVSTTQLDAFFEEDVVRWIERSPSDIEFTNNGMRTDAEVNSVQALGYSGAGIVLGMWDSGLPDATHPDLVGRITAGEGGLTPLAHPTHVAGVAIGDGTNSGNQGGNPLQWRGVATQASVVVYSAVDAVTELNDAIQNHDIDLSTNSWVYSVSPLNCSTLGDYGSDAPELDAIVRGLYGKKLPIVFAAGNERDDGDCGIDSALGYHSLPPPGTAKNVITVGAHHSDAGFMTPFSSWGPTDDGRMKPDISAPGCQTAGDFGITSTTQGGTYSALCGTSQATPVISGSIAIIYEDWRARFSGDPWPSTCKALLGGFAKDRAGAGPDYRFGLGAVNLARSIRELTTATTIQDDVADAALDAWPFIVAPGTDTLVVTLAWDDPPGAELADTTLVNDLDLTLQSPAAATLLPFVLDPANPSALAVPGTNRLDNVEQVRVIAPVAGAWMARVNGTSVPQGPQTYSLVGFDRRPPADPAAFAATGTSDSTVALTWIRAQDADRAGTLLARSLVPINWVPVAGVTYAAGNQPVPGVTIVFAADDDHSAIPFIDSGLAAGTTYFYAAYSRDEIPNYSPGAQDSGTTTGTPVGAPQPELGLTAAVRLDVEGANPFINGVALRFELPRETTFTLTIYDARGRKVETLRRGTLGAGSHRAEWAASNERGERVPAGMYFARLDTAGTILVKKLVLLR
ncbi:MAG TPA: S8 family serine peptidase [bacterium]|nr:S8 family serine peptidase [bacterium]